MKLKEHILNTVNNNGKFVFWHKLSFKRTDLEFALNNHIVIEIDLSFYNGNVIVGHPKSFYKRLPFISNKNISLDELVEYLDKGLYVILDCKHDKVVEILNKRLSSNKNFENVILHGFIKEWSNHKYSDEEISLSQILEHDCFVTSVGNNWEWFDNNNLFSNLKDLSGNKPLGVGLFVRYLYFLIPKILLYQKIANFNFLPVMFYDSLLFKPKFKYIGLSFFANNASRLR